MALNPLNALIFGHDDAAFYLADHEVGTSTITGLYTPVPATFVEAGWLDPEGVAVTPDDSVTEHTGHQGGGVVVQSMQTSKTSLNLSLLETKFQILQWIWSARDQDLDVETVGTEEVDVASFTMPRRRRIQNLCGVYDDWNTAGGGGKIRLVFPLLSLGARETLQMSNNSITSHSLALQWLDDVQVYSDIEGIVDGVVPVP